MVVDNQESEDRKTNEEMKKIIVGEPGDYSVSAFRPEAIGFNLPGIPFPVHPIHVTLNVFYVYTNPWAINHRCGISITISSSDIGAGKTIDDYIDHKSSRDTSRNLSNHRTY